jgi:hypothetical protein
MRINEIFDGSWYDALSGARQKIQQTKAGKLGKKATVKTVLYNLRQAMQNGEPIDQAVETVKAELLKLKISPKDAEYLLNTAKTELESRDKYRDTVQQNKTDTQQRRQAQQFQSAQPEHEGVIWLMPFNGREFFKSYTGRWYEKDRPGKEFSITHPMSAADSEKLNQELEIAKTNGQVTEVPVQQSPYVPNIFIQTGGKGKR